jgi:hypothetical protein
MADEAQLEKILRLEIEVLRAICSENANGKEDREKSRSQLLELLRELQDYCWRGDEHRVVYGALMAVKRSSGETIAEQLPAQATRMGFPDVDWELYLQPSGAHQTEFENMIRALKVGSPAKT